MPDLRDISIGSRYTGDSALGGGSFGVAQIDTKPFDVLAAYSFAYNQKMWEQKQKELEVMAKETAEVTAYDLTNAIPKYAKHLRDKLAGILAWGTANPDVKNYYKNPKGYDEWRKKLNELDNDIKDGATQEIIAAAAKKEIEAAKTPEEKAELQRQLDEEIAAKDIRTPLTIHKYNAVPSKIPEIPIKTFDFTKRGANGLIAQRKFKAADQGFIVSQAFLNANNMQGETGEDLTNMPEDVRELKIQEAKMRKATGRNAEVDQAIIITEALRDKSLRDENGKIDLEKIAASSNPIISGLIEGMINYNKIMDEELALIDQGAYSDNLGVLIPGVKGMKRNDYKKIDFSDGEITAYDLLLVKYRGNAPVTTWETETKELNNAIQMEQMRSAERMNREDNEAAIKLKKLGLPINEDGSVDFGNLIEGVNVPSLPIDGKKGFSVKNGQIYNAKGEPVSNNGDARIATKYLDNAIITEYNKYVGRSKIMPDGSVVADPSASRIKIYGSGFVDVRFKDGQIEGIQTEDGSFVTREQMRHITRVSGQKGKTKHNIGDVDYGKFDDNNKKEGIMSDEEFKDFLKRASK